MTPDLTIYRRIVESTPDAVILADAEGVIRLWNAGAERLFGHTAQEAIGQSLDLIVPERNREAHWAGYDRVMETGVSKYTTDLLNVPAFHKDGQRVSVEFTVALLKDAEGKMEGIAAILRDVTDRFQRDRERTARIRVLEAKVKDLGADPTAI